MEKVIVVGGGASGLVSSIVQRKKGYEVILLEKNDKCGKKLLTTGNGHCNYYNKNQNLEKYHSNNSEFIKDIINEKNLNKLLDFFDSIGIIPIVKDNYYYPYSNTSISIQNTLLIEARRLGVEIKTNCLVKNIKYKNNMFYVETDNTSFASNKLIMSTGSNASIKEECNTYSLLKSLGHSVTKIYPSLTRIHLQEKFLKEWSGVRSHGEIKLLVDSEEVKSEIGEILYTDKGLSGICTMQLSRDAAISLDSKKEVEVVINNMIDFCRTRQEFISFMEDRNKKLKDRNISELLDTIINYKLVNVLIRYSNISINKKYDSLTDREKNILASNFVSLRLKVVGTDDITKSQTVAGGVPLTEINLSNMESRIVPNLYLTGEVIDLDGDCGGYNLTIAFLTGLLTGDNND